MLETKAYEEIVEFIAAGTDPQSVVDFQPSAEVRERVADLWSGRAGAGQPRKRRPSSITSRCSST